MRRARKFKAYLAGILFFLALVATAGIVGSMETHYVRTGKVTEIEDSGIAVIQDTTGNVWAVESAEFATGDSVEFRLFTNGTSDITDDVIEKVYTR